MRPGPSFRVPRGSLAKLIPYALGVWPLLAAALVCILTGSLLELAVPWVMGFLLLDTVIKEARLDELPRVVFLLVAIFVGQKGVGLFQDYFEELANQRLVHRLRCDLFHHLQHLPVRFFDRGRTGELTARVTSDIDSVEGFLPLLVDDVVTDAVLLLGTLYFLFRVEPRLTLYIAPTILALAFMLFLFKPRVRRFARRVRSMIGDLAAMASETLAGVRVVKGFLGEDYEERRFAAQSLQVLRARVGVVMLRSVSSATVDLGVLLGTVIVVSVAAPKVVAGTFSVGALVAYLGYLSKLYGPAKRLSKVNVSIQKIVAAAERIFEVSDLPPEERVDAVLAVRPVPPTDRLAGIGSERETRAPRQSPTQSVEPDAVVSTDAAAGPGSITSRHDHRELQRSQRERRIRYQLYRVWFYGVADIRRVGCRHDLWQSGSIHSIQRTEWNDGHRRDSGHGWWNHVQLQVR
ncbi:MAG: hypothetical protein DMF94_23060 [Acidobacteria bacterium]|nr:MAG: hypothetical protein DMF94_23060 [Acidobacteriota bacterium]